MVLNAIFGGISIKGETPFYHEMKFWLLYGSLICNEQIQSKLVLVLGETEYPKFYLKLEKDFIHLAQPSEVYKLRFSWACRCEILALLQFCNASGFSSLPNIIATSTHHGERRFRGTPCLFSLRP